MPRKKSVEDFESDSEPTTVDLTELEGVGPQTAGKLASMGYTTFESIAVASPAELAASIGVSETTASKIIASARKRLKIGVETAYDYYLKRKNIVKITTGVRSLDTLIGGGIETQTITEIYGPYGSGKTQLAHQLAVTTQLPIDKGGYEKGVLYIDTEHTFRPERIAQIAEAFGLDPVETLKNIWYARVFTSDHQMLITEKAEALMRPKNIGLVIIDSLISHFRGEYVGRETLAVRQQKLNLYMHKLLKLATVYNAAVLVTNQVLADPSTFYGDPTRPAGGHILGHGVTMRLYIRKGKKGVRVVRLMKSPYLPEGEVEILITEKGIIEA